jgi:hypothetical protein
MAVRWSEVVVDAHDPAALAAFWCEALGWSPTGRYAGAVEVGPGDGGGPTLSFVPAGQAKAGKNRLHLDLVPLPGSSQASEVRRLVALGARHADIGQGTDVPWVVLADPEGNEFCVLTSS